MNSKDTPTPGPYGLYNLRVLWARLYCTATIEEVKEVQTPYDTTGLVATVRRPIVRRWAMVVNQ